MGKLLTNKLKSTSLKTLPPGNHSDGNCLFLRVGEAGARSWVFRAKIDGKAKEFGLGSLSTRTLKEARALALEMRRAILQNKNPKDILAPKRSQKTFSDYATELFESKRHEWRNKKHAQQWGNSLRDYAMPYLGKKTIGEIKIADIVRVLNPIWTTKTETATRVRQRIESIIDYGIIHEDLDKANPARWRNCLDKVLPRPGKIKQVKNHAAIHYKDMPEVMAALRQNRNMSAYIARWVILTGCRVSEATGLPWCEIDMDARVWTKPAERTKRNRIHRVPLSGECMAILEEMNNMKSLSKNDYVFINRSGNSMNRDTILKRIKAVAGKELTTHGVRSTLIDWAAEKTNHSNDVRELSLAHSSESKTVLAYKRTDLLEKRRALMNDWCNYLATTPKQKVS